LKKTREREREREKENGREKEATILKYRTVDHIFNFMFSDSVIMVPRKVYTPGSRPPNNAKTRSKAKKVSLNALSPGRGRPGKADKSKKRRAGFNRKGNYRHKYTPETIKKALQEIENKTMTLNEASVTYGVPKTTLYDRMKTASDKVGRPTILTPEEEKIIAERLVILGEWGFPLNTNDLKHLVKAYLDSAGRTTRLENNMPGKDFVSLFLKRHPELTIRTANLIKRSRAMLSAEIINDFFDRYEVSAGGIPAANVYNYDETNLRDNPGKTQNITVPT
jgi:hypothetical protein